ncbi:hypothetical protein VHAB30_05460 [Variovorax boronicumulans]|nr:hypothetical protein VHAB30_05460 [Variovorax boronicumulans]
MLRLGASCGFHLDVKPLAYKVVAFAVGSAPEVADSRSNRREQDICEHPEFTEKADLLTCTEIRRKRTQGCAHIVDDSID